MRHQKEERGLRRTYRGCHKDKKDMAGTVSAFGIGEGRNKGNKRATE